ncbi:unnamed protein product [Amoebophrya sp. A120]|nr:unnamed protein product [Amoebophrya sp. A120]|eukprot:GSA120T00002121001.1
MVGSILLCRLSGSRFWVDLFTRFTASLLLQAYLFLPWCWQNAEATALHLQPLPVGRFETACKDDRRRLTASSLRRELLGTRSPGTTGEDQFSGEAASLWSFIVRLDRNFASATRAYRPLGRPVFNKESLTFTPGVLPPCSHHRALSDSAKLGFGSTGELQVDGEDESQSSGANVAPGDRGGLLRRYLWIHEDEHVAEEDGASATEESKNQPHKEHAALQIADGAEVFIRSITQAEFLQEADQKAVQDVDGAAEERDEKNRWSIRTVRFDCVVVQVKARPGGETQEDRPRSIPIILQLASALADRVIVVLNQAADKTRPTTVADEASEPAATDPRPSATTHLNIKRRNTAWIRNEVLKLNPSNATACTLDEQQNEGQLSGVTFFAMSHVSALSQWERTTGCRAAPFRLPKLGTAHAVVPDGCEAIASKAVAATQQDHLGDDETAPPLVTAEVLNAQQTPYTFIPDRYVFADLRDWILLQRLKNAEYRYGQCVDLHVGDTVGTKVTDDDQNMFGGDRMAGHGLICTSHHFAPHYVRHLKHLFFSKKIEQEDESVAASSQNSPSSWFTVLEIGILQGTGLAMWHDFFQGKASLLGFDINLHPFLRNLETLWLRDGAFSMRSARSDDRGLVGGRATPWILTGTSIEPGGRDIFNLTLVPRRSRDSVLLRQCDKAEGSTLGLYENIDKVFRPRVLQQKMRQRVKNTSSSAGAPNGETETESVSDLYLSASIESVDGKELFAPPGWPIPEVLDVHLHQRDHVAQNVEFVDSTWRKPPRSRLYPAPDLLLPEDSSSSHVGDENEPAPVAVHFLHQELASSTILDLILSPRPEYDFKIPIEVEDRLRHGVAHYQNALAKEKKETTDEKPTSLDREKLSNLILPLRAALADQVHEDLRRNIVPDQHPQAQEASEVLVQSAKTRTDRNIKVVIDDASHLDYLVWRSFVMVEYYLRGDDWVYVVEDCLCTNFLTSLRKQYPHLWIYQYTDGARSAILFIRPSQAE